MATLEIELEIRDEDQHRDDLGYWSPGHIWTLHDPVELADYYGVGPQCTTEECTNCENVATWLRRNIEHPNYVRSDLLCGSCASIVLQFVPATVWGVVRGLEFGYAWEAPITQDRDEAEA